MSINNPSMPDPPVHAVISAQVADVDTNVDSVNVNVDDVDTSVAGVAAQVTVVDGFHDVPTADSADNNQMRDVLGNKSDTYDGDSIFAHAHIVEDHIHKEQKVYPTLADGANLATANGDWELSAFIEIVPINTITSVFDIHEVIIEDVGTADKTYELVLYAGAGDVEVGRTRFAASATKGGVPNATMQTPIIAANSRIRAKLAIQDGGNKIAVVCLRYHTY